MNFLLLAGSRSYLKKMKLKVLFEETASCSKNFLEFSSENAQMKYCKCFLTACWEIVIMVTPEGSRTFCSIMSFCSIHSLPQKQQVPDCAH